MSNAAPLLVFSHLKSFSFALENDIQGMKRALEMRSTSGGLNRNSIHEDENFLRDLQQNALNVQGKYSQLEDSVFGPIENRLSHVTVEEMNERFQSLLESNDKLIHKLAFKLSMKSKSMVDSMASEQQTSATIENFEGGLFDSATLMGNGVDNVNGGEQFFDDKQDDGSDSRDLNNSFNCRNGGCAGDYFDSNLSMEENKDGEFQTMTPNKVDMNVTSELTPDSPIISPAFKIKFQSSYNANSNKLGANNNSHRGGTGVMQFADRVSSSLVGNLAGSLTPETPGASDPFLRCSIQNSDILDTPPTPEFNGNVKTSLITRTNSVNTDKRRAPDPIMNNSSSMSIDSVQTVPVEDKSPAHKILSAMHNSNSNDSQAKINTVFYSNIDSSSRSGTAVGDDDYLNDIDDFSQFKVAKLLQPRAVTAKDGWIPICTPTELKSLPSFLQQQVTISDLNTALELINCHVSGPLASFTHDELSAIIKVSFTETDPNTLISIIKPIIMAIVYLKRLDIVTEAGVKRYKVKKYY